MNQFSKILKKVNGDGIIRRVDELGRIVIPINLRNNKFEPGTEVFLYKFDNYIIVKSNCIDNETGIKRAFDDLGRIQINIEYRNDLNWKEKDCIAVWGIDDCIILKKEEEKCVFCDNNDNTTKFKDKLICDKCKNEICEL